MKTEAQYITENLGRIKACARKLAWQWGDAAQMDICDFVQEGLIGFIRGLRNYEPGPASTATIETYAGRRMFGAMQDAIKHNLRDKRWAPAGLMIDIDESFDIAGEDGREWIDAMHDQRTLERAYQRFEKLPRKQRQVMKLMYVDGLSQADVARQLNTTNGNVSTLHKTAIETLRKMLIN
jgi:RNA polymerase sigma factor (sigma-70 family)